MTFDPVEAADGLGPNPALLLVVVAAIGAISALSLPWQVAIASTVLGALMIAGADIDARTFLLPDWITGGAFGCGVVAAALLQLDETSPLISVVEAILRAVCLAAVLTLFRYGYAAIKRREGLGLGDVKLAAAIGAWLPIQAIPLCFGIATSGALLIVLVAQLKGRAVSRATRIPFGAFLCPALWIVFYADKVMQ